ncbi:hypothetical protein D3C86_2260650 [compost metagenome]
MMFSYIAFRFFVIPKEWEVHNPSVFEDGIIDKSKLTTNFQTQVTQYISYHFLFIR